MEPVISAVLQGLPVFMAHSATAILIFVLSVTVYTWITPPHELRLIRQNNTAAAIALSGAMLGLAVPLGFCLAGSVNLPDLVIWSLVIVALQLIAFKIIDLLLRDLSQRIETGELAAAIALAGAKLSIGVLTASAIAG
jgi:putative membrane protein